MTRSARSRGRERLTAMAQQRPQGGRARRRSAKPKRSQRGGRTLHGRSGKRRQRCGLDLVCKASKKLAMQLRRASAINVQGDPLRKFYESLREQRPESRMAEDWYKVLPPRMELHDSPHKTISALGWLARSRRSSGVAQVVEQQPAAPGDVQGAARKEGEGEGCCQVRPA